MAVNLRTRLEKLEAATPATELNHCLVIHHEDCEADKAAALSAYAERYGHEPEHFIHIYLISAETKKSICGCKWEGAANTRQA